MDETFTKSDFIYGPQIWKPGSVENYPIYYGQNMSDTENTFMIMFIDLGVGALKKGTISPQIDNGAAKVEYSIHNLTSANFAVFDVNSWLSRSNRGTGIKDTNSVDNNAAPSGLSVIITVYCPAIPLPGKTDPPTDPDGDGIVEDMNGNGIRDFNDVVMFFKQMEWVQANEPVSLFDFNGNGYIDFNDIVRLFREL